MQRVKIVLSHIEQQVEQNLNSDDVRYKDESAAEKKQKHALSPGDAFCQEDEQSQQQIRGSSSACRNEDQNFVTGKNSSSLQGCRGKQAEYAIRNPEC